MPVLTLPVLTLPVSTDDEVLRIRERLSGRIAQNTSFDSSAGEILGRAGEWNATKQEKESKEVAHAPPPGSGICEGPLGSASHEQVSIFRRNGRLPFRQPKRALRAFGFRTLAMCPQDGQGPAYWAG